MRDPVSGYAWTSHAVERVEITREYNVTATQFAAFVEDRSYKNDAERYGSGGVTQVSWHDGHTFCSA
jgi:formylglycine-generating enzyme required for sulfatase activity